MNTYLKRPLWLLFFALLFASPSYGQSKSKFGRNRAAKFEEKYLNKQFWVGVKGGGNLTKAKPIERYSSFESTANPGSTEFDKAYKNFEKAGGQAALELTFFYKRFGVSFQPGYRRMSYQYSNSYSWSDPLDETNRLEQNYESVQKLDYFEFPLLVRYEPFKTKLKPFVQLGIYYSHLNNAFKSTTITVNDPASSKGAYETENIQVGAKELYISTNLGWIAGAGVSAPLGNLRIAFDLSYRRNTNNITSINNRYENDRITGSGDILDDIQLRNLSASISLLIPLRFIILKENYKTE